MEIGIIEVAGSRRGRVVAAGAANS